MIQANTSIPISTTMTTPTIEAAICIATVIQDVITQGVDATLEKFPELTQHRDLLEEVCQAEIELSLHERLAEDYRRRLDELGFELASVLG